MAPSDFDFVFDKLFIISKKLQNVLPDGPYALYVGSGGRCGRIFQQFG